MKFLLHHLRATLEKLNPKTNRMSKKKEVKQGEIWMCNLPKGEDSEQMWVRPYLCISTDIRNESSSNVFIFPITHAKKKKQPCHYILYKENYPFFTYKENTVLCEEGRSISKNRLERRLGMIFAKDIIEILKCKEFVFVEKNDWQSSFFVV